MMTVFAYARVSTNDQTVENQKLEIQNAGYSIAEEFWFCDSGVSGSVPAMEREAFKNLVNKIRAGETLVVSKLDRLGRNSLDILKSLALLQKLKVKVVCLQLGNLDLNSAPGKLMLVMLSAVAEMEKDLLIERTKAGQTRAWNEGKQKGRPVLTTANQRQRIKELLKNEKTSVSQVARDFKISRATVISIRDDEPKGN